MKNLFLILLFMFASLRTQAQNSCQPPSYFFNNKTNVSGSGGVGSVYRFNNVLTGINAIVTITKVQNASINNANMDNASGYGIAWQPFITFPSSRSLASDTSYLEFRIEFRASAAPAGLVNQNCMAMTIIDCDGNNSNNSFREMMKVSRPGTPMGIQSSSITVFEDNNWVLFKSGISQFSNIDTQNLAAMGQMNFPSGINTMVMRVGVVGPVPSNTQRQYSFFFRSFAALTTPLPVYLSGLNAKPEAAHVRLNWLSTHEENFGQFDVYRSFDGVQFDKIGSIAGKGNSNQVNQYSYLDPSVLSSANTKVYYKLQMIDLNGSGIWSHVVVNETPDNQILPGSVLIYPNPSEEMINIRYEGSVNISNVRITDIYGKTITENSEVDLEHGLGIDVSKYEDGIYLIHLSGEDGSSICTRFIKN